MLIYFFNKKLPWQLIKAKNELERFIKTYIMKKTIKLEILCNDLPKEVLLYMKYVQRLGFEENPDYKYLQ